MSQSYSQFYKSPQLRKSDVRWLREVDGALRPICEAIVQGARPTLQDLETALPHVKGLSDDWNLISIDKSRYHRLLALDLQRQGRCNLLERLITVFAWLLRDSPDIAHLLAETDNPYLLIAMRKYLQISVTLVAALPRDRHYSAAAAWNEEPLWPVQESFCLVLLRTKPLHCLSQLLQLSRQDVEASWSIGTGEQQQDQQVLELERAGMGWCEAVSTVDPLIKVLEGSAFAQLRQDLASSHLLEHLCALRLVLADGMARLEGSRGAAGTGAVGQEQQQEQEHQEPAAPPPPPPQQQEREQQQEPPPPPPLQQQQQQQHRLLSRLHRLAALLQQHDRTFLTMLLEGTRGVTIGLQVADVRVTASRVLAPEAPHVCMHSVSLPSLSHPAVQCLLGWWLVAPGVVGGWRGAGRWRLPEALERDFRRIQDEVYRGGLAAAALSAASHIWPALLRSGFAFPAGASAGREAPAAAATGPVAGGEAGISEPELGSGLGPGASSGSVGGAPAAPVGEGRGAAGRVLSYSPVDMYRVCRVAVEEMARREMGSDGEEVPGGWGAMEAGEVALVELLEFLPPDQAARRLPGAWRVLFGKLSRRTSDTNGLWYAGYVLRRLTHLRPPAGAGGLGQEAVARCAGGEQGAGVVAGSASGSGAGAGAGAGDGGGGGSGSGGDGVAAADPQGRAAEGTGSPSPSPSLNPGGGPPYVLSCALSEGLLAVMESGFRSDGRAVAVVNQSSPKHVMGYARAVVIQLDFVLRRPGCWPALLAHGGPQQAAALVVSLGKAARTAAGLPWPPADDVEGVLDVRPTLRLQLLGLLEQLLVVQLQAGGGREPAAAVTAGSGKGRRLGSSSDQQQQQQQQGAQLGLWESLGDLPLNRGVGEADSADSTQAGAAGAGGAGPSGGNGHLAPPPTGAAGPHGCGLTLKELAEAGGCPAPGTPPAQQLARMAGLAAVEWLPVLLVREENGGVGVGSAGTGLGTGAGVRAAPMTELLPHGAYRVAWAWLRLVGVQGLGPGGAGQEAWVDFLLGPLAALQQVQQVIMLACWQHGTHQPGERVLAACEVLPAALDVLEVVAGVRPGEVARALWENAEYLKYMKALMMDEAGDAIAGVGPGLAFNEPVRKLLRSQGREELMHQLRRLAGEGAGGRESVGEERGGDGGGSGGGREVGAVGEQWGGGGGREQVARRVLAGGGVPHLPHPSEGEVVLLRCGFAGCQGLEGSSEAELRLYSCRRCRVVGYCCSRCQLWDWEAGHKHACARLAGGLQGA